MDTVGGSARDALAVSNRRWLRWMWIPGVFAAVAAGLWWIGHPSALPTGATEVSATTKVGVPVYFGVVAAAGENHRSLEIDKVDIAITWPEDATGVSVEVLICKGGSIGQTSAPDRFCQEVVPAEDHTLRLAGGDQLMVSVAADDPGTVEIDRLEIDFREGLQRGTQPIGSPYSVTVVG